MAGEHAIAAADGVGKPPEFDRLINDEERRYINAHTHFDTTPAQLPAGGQLKPLKKSLKFRGGTFIVGVLGRYFADEHEFIAHLVRLQNKLTANHDRLGNEIRALHLALQVESERLRQANAVLHDRLEERISALEDQLQSMSVVERA